MPTREVVVSVASYTNAKGVRDFALRGETIDVHPDHVERFDLLNVVPGASERPAEVVIDDTEEVADDEPETLDTTPEQPEDETPAKPEQVAEDASVVVEGAQLEGDERLNAVLDLDAPKRPRGGTRAKG